MSDAASALREEAAHYREAARRARASAQATSHPGGRATWLDLAASFEAKAAAKMEEARLWGTKAGLREIHDRIMANHNGRS